MLDLLRSEGEPVELELDALEEHAVDRVDVLVGVGDVAVMVEDEPGDRRHDSLLIRARQQQYRSRWTGGRGGGHGRLST